MILSFILPISNLSFTGYSRQNLDNAKKQIQILGLSGSWYWKWFHIILEGYEIRFFCSSNIYLYLLIEGKLNLWYPEIISKRLYTNCSRQPKQMAFLDHFLTHTGLCYNTAEVRTPLLNSLWFLLLSEPNLHYNSDWNFYRKTINLA